MNKYSSIIIGTGSYLPKNVISNEELAKKVDTNDEWITSRTGIKQRHIIAEGELTSDMASMAAKHAIEAAKISSDHIGMIIVCTTTPDNSFPAVAAKVQANLSIKNIPVFDIQAVCSGFVYGLFMADSFIKSGAADNILVIGADAMSKLLDWQDRSTCVLFGDGAGAVIVKASDNSQDEGIISCQIGADGAYDSILYTDGGVVSTGTAGFIRMAGREVFKQAVEKMSLSIINSLEQTKYSKKDLNWVIPHQANARILSAIATKLDLPNEKMVMTLDKHANTCAATIPLALDHYVRTGMIKTNDLIMMTALGGGITWGSCLLRWK